MSPAQVQAVFQSFKKAVIERAMGAEMTHHLGYEEGASRPEGQTNHRNGSTDKTVLTEEGPVRITVPRDRDGAFAPILIPKHARRFTGFDDKIVAMYARGMTVREIHGFLGEQYGTPVSPDFNSSVTDAVLADVTAWQERPLEPLYPVIFLDALRVKIRDDGVVQSKAVYVALGLRVDGQREVLGLWIEQTEGAKFWLKVLNGLKTRGVQDILIAVAAVLRPIYTAGSAEAAAAALEAFVAGPWGQQYLTIAPTWRRVWAQVIPFFVFPPDVRRVLYTTNAIESLHMQLRKIIKARGHFPTDDAALKPLWLDLQRVCLQTIRSVRPWHEALTHFAVFNGERFTAVHR